VAGIFLIDSSVRGNRPLNSKNPLHPLRGDLREAADDLSPRKRFLIRMQKCIDQNSDYVNTNKKSQKIKFARK